MERLNFMGMIKGTTIIYVARKKIGEDDFRHPIYEETEEQIENVLIVPASSTDVVSSQDLEGKKVVYTLAIPKGDEHNWENAIVKFFGQTWKTFGYPMEGIEENIPLDWNKKVMVKRYG